MDIKKDLDNQWFVTERSEAAESALTREYHYHMLRAEELRNFLSDCGIQVGSE